MNNKVLNIIIMGILMMFSSLVLSATPTLKSGKYEALMLAVTPDRTVEGYYFEKMGEGVTRTCSFYLKGTIGSNREVPITSWSTEILTGMIVPNNDSVTITIPQGSTHEGCMGSMGSQIDFGLELSLIQDKEWIGLVTITGDRVNLKANPQPRAKYRSYVVKNDVVGVLRTQKDWLFVEFISDDNESYKGWIHRNEFTPFTIPVDQKNTVVKQ